MNFNSSELIDFGWFMSFTSLKSDWADPWSIPAFIFLTVLLRFGSCFPPTPEGTSEWHWCFFWDDCFFSGRNIHVCHQLFVDFYQPCPLASPFTEPADSSTSRFRNDAAQRKRWMLRRSLSLFLNWKHDASSDASSLVVCWIDDFTPDHRGAPLPPTTD